jgi:cAMP-dependent protein kinase regulator
MSDESHTPDANRRTTLERLWADVAKLIEGSHLFRSLDEDGRRELLNRGRIVSFPAGSLILREGEPGESFFVVDQGVVEVSTHAAAAGGEIPLTTLQRGAFFGEVAVLTGSPRTATVTALTDVHAVAFDKADVDELLASNAKARRLLQAVMTGRARDTAEKIARASSFPPARDDDGDE